MSQAVAVHIAQAVTDALNDAAAGTFVRDFTAQRLYRPYHKLEELASLKVSVMPRQLELEPTDRTLDRHELVIDIGVQQQVDPDNAGDLDELMLLTEQIERYLNRRRLEALPDARWISSAIAPLFVPEHLAEQRVFTGVVSPRYALAAGGGS